MVDKKPRTLFAHVSCLALEIKRNQEARSHGWRAEQDMKEQARREAWLTWLKSAERSTPMDNDTISLVRLFFFSFPFLSASGNCCYFTAPLRSMSLYIRQVLSFCFYLSCRQPSNFAKIPTRK